MFNESIEILYAHAEGRISHKNNGECPDVTNGHQSRDKSCPVCRAMDAMPQKDAQKDTQKEEPVNKESATTISTVWFNPSEFPPPFGQKILAMVAGNRSTDAGQTFERYTDILTAYVQKEGVNDEYEEVTAYEEYVAGESTNFMDFQFMLENEDGEELDWYSDNIIGWSLYPVIASTIALAWSGN